MTTKPKLLKPALGIWIKIKSAEYPDPQFQKRPLKQLQVK